jgi:hypothetical protein
MGYQVLVMIVIEEMQKKWLVSFKKSDDCWMVSSHLLENHVVCHPAELLFAA